MIGRGLRGVWIQPRKSFLNSDTQGQCLRATPFGVENQTLDFGVLDFGVSCSKPSSAADAFRKCWRMLEFHGCLDQMRHDIFLLCAQMTSLSEALEGAWLIA